MESRGAQYDIADDPTYGFKRLHPIPSPEVLRDFYTGQFYASRDAHMSRLAAKGEKARQERNWIEATLYSDILSILARQSPVGPANLLDVGCGTGDFLKFLRQSDSAFTAVGIELSPEAVSSAREQGLRVYLADLAEFVRQEPGRLGIFTVITMLNILEHLPDPAGGLKLARELLSPGGLICIRVPNDFSPMQSWAAKAIGKDRWWVSVPDHINYFGAGSLRRLLESTGFQVLYKQTDFPMELFLLMGINYLEDKKIGWECHQRRVRFEMSVPPHFRRQLYQFLADLGVGRSLLFLARRWAGGESI